MSILDLFKQNGMSILLNNQLNEPSKMDNGKIHNPDINGDMSATDQNVKTNAYNKVKGQKAYLLFNNQRFDKLRGKQLNGDFLRSSYPTNYGNHSYNQQLEGAIDPENMMRKINPIRVTPYDYINGAEGLNFRDLPSSVFTSHNSTQLLSKARNSYASKLVSLGQLPSLQMINIPFNNIL